MGKVKMQVDFGNFEFGVGAFEHSLNHVPIPIFCCLSAHGCLLKAIQFNDLVEKSKE